MIYIVMVYDEKKRKYINKGEFTDILKAIRFLNRFRYAYLEEKL